MTNFDCDYCGEDAEEIHQIDDGNSFICENCYVNNYEE